MTLTDFLHRLEGVAGSNGQYSARCPGHADKHNSLSVSVGTDGKILLNCHAGCSTDDILGAMGLTMRDLFFGAPNTLKEPRQTQKAWFEAEYIYHDETGAPILKKIKMREADGGKYCYWMHYKGNAWIKGRNSIEPPLYTVGQLGHGVILVEGEKDVETFKTLNAASVSLPDGAESKWLPQYSDALRGRQVFIIQDNDKPGKQFAQRQAKELQGVASCVKVIDLTTVWPDMPEHGDATDLIEHMGQAAGWEAIKKLIQDTPEWIPAKDPFLSCFRTLDSFEEEEATWLVPGWIPEGQITLMAADGGIGKTTLWCNLITALSNGTSCILDPPDISRTPAQVAFLTTEDSVRKKLKKKLRTAGANERNILTPDFLADKEGLLRNLKFGSHEMEQFIKYFKPKLCVFDPVQGFIPPELNMGSRNAMRDCLAPLISLGEETGTTFLIICHTNKRKGAFGRDRIADSADLWDISRSVLMAGYTEDQGIRYLSNEKNNYTQLQETLLFTIDSGGQVLREGTSWKRDREYMQDADFSRSAPKREDCKDFILNTLSASGGSMSSKDLEEKARDAGYSFRTLRRAKEELKENNGVKYVQTGTNKDRSWHVQRINNEPFVQLDETTPVPWDEGA